MKHSTILSARRRTLRALGEYNAFTPDELTTELAELHQALDDAEHSLGFSPAARRGVRAVLIQQLHQIDAEYQRRLVSVA